MDSQSIGPKAHPLLEDATGTLERALSEACGTEVRTADTGELVRIERALVEAADAAERAVSIRRRARAEERSSAGATAAMSDILGEVAVPDTHRVFEDAAGVTWDAFAVHPSAEAAGKARLPGPFQRGWLSFDSGEERRRLSPIPEGWQTMSDASLREACQRAEIASRRPGTGRQAPRTEQ